MNWIRCNRTLVGVVLFVPLAVVLLVTFACLPAPVGDPEQASVNEKLTGAWQLVPEVGSSDLGLVIVRPWDKHTSFLQYLPVKRENGEESARSVNFKSWLTTFGETTIITCEALDTKDFMAAGIDQDHYFWVAKLELKENTVVVTPIKDDSPLFKDVKTQEKEEEILKANISNPDIYAKPLTFKKLSKEELSVVDGVRKLAHVGFEDSSNSTTEPAK